MLYARLRLERVFDLRYRDLDSRWYPAERRGDLLVLALGALRHFGPASHFETCQCVGTGGGTSPHRYSRGHAT